MERFAAESLTADRNAHIKAALKSNRPWMDVMADFGLTLAEIMDIAEKMGMVSKRGNVVFKDESKEPLIVARRGRRD